MMTQKADRGVSVLKHIAVSYVKYITRKPSNLIIIAEMCIHIDTHTYRQSYPYIYIHTHAKKLVIEV